MILAYRPDTEWFAEENCHIVELDNHAGDPGCSIARARVAPGATTRRHSLVGTIERYVILEGEGRVEIGDAAPLRVGPLDVAIIPAGVSQRITNVGTVDLVFLCVCTPRFMPENYRALEGWHRSPEQGT